MRATAPKRERGRPPLPEDQRATAELKTKVPPSLRARVQAAAAAESIDVSAWLRQTVERRLSRISRDQK